MNSEAFISLQFIKGFLLNLNCYMDLQFPANLRRVMNCVTCTRILYIHKCFPKVVDFAMTSCYLLYRDLEH